MKDAPLRKCPHCGKNTLERLIGTGAAILFKGSGFYETDYRSEAYKSAQKAESSGSSGKESKPAEPGAPKPADGSAAKSEPATKATTDAKPKPDKPAGGKKRKQ